MLQLLNVPKGTRLMIPSITGSTVCEYPNLSTKGVYTNYSIPALQIPYPGSPVLGIQSYDLGWLANTNDHGGQKDVEHLDLDGVLIPRSMCRSVGPRKPSMTASPPCAQMFSLLLLQESDQKQYETWLTDFVPYLGRSGCMRTRTVRNASTEPWAPWKFSNGAFWPSHDCVVQYSYYGRIDTTRTYFATVRWMKFSSDFTGYVTGTKNVSLLAAEIQQWTSPLDKLWYAIYSDYISATPAVGNVLRASFSTTADILADPLPTSKILDRSYVLQGELNPVWGDLAYDCYSQIQLWNSNGLAYGRDLTLVTRAVRDLVKSAKALLISKSPSEAAKPLADLFLSFRYGWYLSAKDTISLLKADFERAYPMGRCKRSSSYTYFRNGYTIVARMSVYCRPYSDSVSALGDLLSMFDCDLSLQNIWDLIPYSFVIDWVVDVGGILDRLDMLGRLDSYRIFLTGQSLKVSALRAANEILQLDSMVGTVTVRYYKRNYTTDVIPPSLASSRTPSQNEHWLEGTALVVQRIG